MPQMKMHSALQIPLSEEELDVWLKADEENEDPVYVRARASI